MFRWKAHNTKADGHCFYRAIVNSTRSDQVLQKKLTLLDLDEMEAVLRLRYLIKRSIQDSPKVQQWLCELVLLVKEAPCVLDEYPLMKVNSDESIGDRILNSNVWASSFEIDIIRSLMELQGIALLIVSDTTKDDLLKSTKIEEELMGIISGPSMHLTRCIVLIRLTASEHYMYCTLNGEGVMQVEELHECLSEYVSD